MTVDMMHPPAKRIATQYPTSWIDRMIRWIDRLPGPPWLFYLTSTLALTVLITVVMWIDGSVPFGSYGSI